MVVSGGPELLPLHALALGPGLAAPGHVGGLLAVGDDAFEVHAAGALMDLRTGRVEVLRVAQPPAPAAEQPCERLLALEQRLGPQIPAVEEEQVEGHVRETPSGRALRALLEGP